MHRLITILIIVVLVIITAATAFEAAYLGKIYPGATVAGINLGNRTVDRAMNLLKEKLLAPPILLAFGTSRWTILPEAIGLEYDAYQSAQRAYLVGRQGPIWAVETDKWRSLTQGRVVSPVFSWQENQLVATIASVSAQIDIPAREPQVQIDQGQVAVSLGENGRVVDERQLRLTIQRAITTLSSDPVEIPVVQLTPKLSPAQAESLRLRAKALLDKKLTLTLEGRLWNIAADQIFTWLDASGWNRPQIEVWAGQLAASVDRPAQNALFKYVGSGRVEEFKPARDGLTVNQGELVNLIVSQLDQLETQEKISSLPIPITRTAPTIVTSAVNDLGIKELVGRGESNFAGSIPNRIFNLKKAAGNMNGILVAPGETFSFNKYVGDISTEGGYKQAYIIKEGKTILGDGGGVCQVSTTLFRAVLDAGLPIIERTAHAYRVHYYEQDSQPGFDATIFTPSVDFKFKNDTPAHLLIQASVNEATKKLVFEIYGTSDGRSVTLSKARIWDIVPPPPDLYTDDPTLPAGTVRQVDWKAWGAKVAFDYQVTRGDEALQSRTFYSNFRPWQAVFLRGPQ